VPRSRPRCWTPDAAPPARRRRRPGLGDPRRL